MKPIVVGFLAMGANGVSLALNSYLPPPEKVAAVLSWAVCAFVGAFVSHSHAKIRAARKGQIRPLPAFGWVYARGVAVGLILATILSPLAQPGTFLREMLPGLVMIAGMLAELLIEGVWKLGEDFSRDPGKYFRLFWKRYQAGKELEETGRFRPDEIIPPRANGAAKPPRRGGDH